MKRFLNLSNGLEAINGGFDGFVRIQSSHLESKSWGGVIAGLDANFLMWAAVGPVEIVDGGSRSGEESRAVWQGIPWITFVLQRAWFDEIKQSFVRNVDVTRDFWNQYKELDKKVLKNIKYFRTYLAIEDVDIRSVNFRAKWDGKKDVYRKIWLDYCGKPEMICA